MGLRVAKFGGSSVADALQIEKIKEIVEGNADRKYVIVSAPGKRYGEDTKVTDLLYLCKTHIEHKLPYEQIFQVICDRYTVTEVNLGITLDLKGEFEKIRKNLEEGTTVDYIASRGEYLNAIIIAAYLGYDFVDAEELVIFDKHGRFKSEETNEQIKKVLKDHERAVIPGFYGRTEEGKVKTFSRGGSDVTGSIVARAMDADVYENWTDVSGFLMADPRIVENPKPIDVISYRELRELSYMGASVLHEDAIYPARIANIPINIRNTNIPDDEGTIINDNSGVDGRIITGIAGSKNFTSVTIYKNMLNAQRGFVRKLSGILEDMDIPIEHMPSGIDTISVVINNDDLKDRTDELVDSIEKQLSPDSIDVSEDIALIATVGAGMSSRAGVSAKLFSALAAEGVNIRMIDQGSSEMNIIVGVESKDFEKSIKAIYNAFENQQ